MTSLPLKSEGQLFKSENYSKQSLEHKVFISCSFDACDFTESILRNAKFCSCTFVNCNLSLMKLEGCRFQDIQFKECKIVGAEFYKCESAFFSMNFKNCSIQYCNFSDLNMKNTSFANSSLKESYFTHTCLTGADFNGVNLQGTIFHNCDLCKADFSTATEYDIDPQTNKIKKAKFSLPEAVGLLRGFDITLI